MGVQTIAAMGRLAGRTNIKANFLSNMHMLITIFGYASPDNRKIFFKVAPWRMGINKGVFAGDQFPITYDIDSQARWLIFGRVWGRHGWVLFHFTHNVGKNMKLTLTLYIKKTAD